MNGRDLTIGHQGSKLNLGLLNFELELNWVRFKLVGSMDWVKTLFLSLSITGVVF